MGPTSPDPEPTLRGHATGTRVFGRYTLGQLLGRGGMGVVWQARDEVLGEDVALKFLPDAVRWDPGAYEDLKDETRRARQLTHPNIIRIHYFVEDASGAAISMELVKGATLTALRMAREGRLFDPADILPWLPQLGAALDYAHTQARIVHRDLKPTNIMLTPEGVLKVGDFGIARSLADSVTRVSMMSAGTLVYMSPQQAMGEEPSPADDIYALGATLYELLTGKPPFHTGDVRVQLFQRRPDSIAARRKLLAPTAAEVPAAWETTIAACLAKEPSSRPASAGEVARRLGGVGPTVERRRPWWRRRRTRREWGLAAVVIALAMLTAMVFTRSTPATAAPFPSDASRALAAWNFDGDARDASGRGFDGINGQAMPTPDRFGRIDRALRFNGRAGVQVEDAPALRWGGKQPFTAALWVRQDESPTVNGDVWTCVSTKVGSLDWGLGFADGRGAAHLGGVFTEGRVVLRATERLAPGTWHHLALVSDGSDLGLWVDGKSAATASLGPQRDVSTSPASRLLFGTPSPLSTWGLTGALDEARLWRRALAPAEIAALASREAPGRMVRSTGSYQETDDLVGVIRTEFGEGARLADWTELKRWHADDARGWAEDAEIEINDNATWVQRDGQRTVDGTRYYFVQRFDGAKPPYFKIHDELGGGTLVLGSWYGIAAAVLATLPPPLIASERLLVDPADGRIRRNQPFGPSRTAVALTWRARLTKESGSGVAARLRLDDGREVQAVCRVAEDALALALGPTVGGGISHSIRPKLGEYDFTVVAKHHRLSFRGVSAVGGNVLFSDVVDLPQFRLASVAGIELEGGPNSGLAAATLVLE